MHFTCESRGWEREISWPWLDRTLMVIMTGTQSFHFQRRRLNSARFSLSHFSRYPIFSTLLRRCISLLTLRFLFFSMTTVNSYIFHNAVIIRWKGDSLNSRGGVDKLTINHKSETTILRNNFNVQSRINYFQYFFFYYYINLIMYVCTFRSFLPNYFWLISIRWPSKAIVIE